MDSMESGDGDSRSHAQHFDSVEWLNGIYRSYANGGAGSLRGSSSADADGGEMTLPVLVAAEILLGASDPETIAGSLGNKGICATPPEVAAAVDELIELGWLEVSFEASSPIRDGATEQVLILRWPDIPAAL